MIFQERGNQKKVGIDFKPKRITREEEGRYVMQRDQCVDITKIDVRMRPIPKHQNMLIWLKGTDFVMSS